MDNSDKSEAAPGNAMTRRLRTLEGKLSILAEEALPGGPVAAIARKHDVNANHAPPLLPAAHPGGCLLGARAA